MYNEMEPMPSMQRLITLGDVIYVHSNQMRRRRAPATPPLPEPDESLAQLAVAVPADAVEPNAVELNAVEPNAVDADAVEADAAETTPTQVNATDEAVGRPSAWSTWVEGARGFAAPAPPAPDTGWDDGIPRSRPVPPPPGYAIEFGTGRLVPVHSMRGRMSYPSSENG